MLIWTIGSVAVLMGVIYLLVVELQLPLFGFWRWLVPLMALNWYPVWQHLHAGQFTILLFALIVGAWYCESRGHSWLAGFLLGFATLLKIYPILLLGYALLRGRWRVIGGAAATILVLVLLQAAVNPEQWVDYVLRVAPANAAEWMPFARNASLASVSMRLFVGSSEIRPLFDAPQFELPTRIILYCIALGVLAALFWRLRKRPDLTGEYCLGLSAIALLSPISWDHSAIFLLMPFAYIWQQAHMRPGRWRRDPLAWMGLALLLSMFPAEVVFANLKRAYQLQQMPPIVHLHATGVAVLLCGFAAIVLTLWRLPIPAEEGQSC
jgi:alpha-1,2-mannosyltransferase